MNRKYKFKIEKHDYDKGTFLLGFNLNTNDEWCSYDDDDNIVIERETYVVFYLGKFSLIIGKFH